MHLTYIPEFTIALGTLQTTGIRNMQNSHQFEVNVHPRYPSKIQAPPGSLQVDLNDLAAFVLMAPWFGEPTWLGDPAFVTVHFRLAGASSHWRNTAKLLSDFAHIPKSNKFRFSRFDMYKYKYINIYIYISVCV